MVALPPVEQAVGPEHPAEFASLPAADWLVVAVAVENLVAIADSGRRRLADELAVVDER